MPYPFGALVPITGEVRNAAKVLTNATTVSLEILRPDGVIDTPTVTNPPTSTGVYAYDYLPTVEDGPYRWYLSTTGPSSALSGSFYVLAKFPNYLISLDEAKAQLNITSDTSDDELMAFISAATGVIERHTGKVITRRTIAERVTAYYDTVLWLNHRPILSVTSIVSGVTTWPVGAAVGIDSNLGVISVLSGNYWTGDLLVTYVAGMTTIPSEYTLAARIIVQHLWQTQRGQRGGPRVGGIDPGLPGLAPPAGFAIPNAALELLGPQPPMVA